jgi:probable addiction module antidote protein
MGGPSVLCVRALTGSDWVTSETRSQLAVASMNCVSTSAPDIESILDAEEASGRRRVILSRRKGIGRGIWMPKPAVNTESYRESLLESLKDPDEATQYLNACLEDGDVRVFLLALRDVAEARGGIRALSRTARLNRESLYRMLSKSGNPSLDSLSAVLNACGLRLAVQSTGSRRRKRVIA